MGGSSSKKIKEEELNNAKRDESSQKKQKKEINQNIPSIKIKTNNNIIKEEIKIFKKNMLEKIDENKKDNNLVITNYFIPNNYIISNEKNIQENIRLRYHEILNQINNKNLCWNLNDYDNINQRINSYFGLQKSIKDDFNKTKTNLLYCSSLSEIDERFINNLDFNKYFGDEKKFRPLITNIINNNINEMNIIDSIK